MPSKYGFGNSRKSSPYKKASYGGDQKNPIKQLPSAEQDFANAGAYDAITSNPSTNAGSYGGGLNNANSSAGDPMGAGGVSPEVNPAQTYYNQTSAQPNQFGQFDQNLGNQANNAQPNQVSANPNQAPDSFRQAENMANQARNQTQTRRKPRGFMRELLGMGQIGHLRRGGGGVNAANIPRPQAQPRRASAGQRPVRNIRATRRRTV